MANPSDCTTPDCFKIMFLDPKFNNIEAKYTSENLLNINNLLSSYKNTEVNNSKKTPSYNNINSPNNSVILGKKLIDVRFIIFDNNCNKPPSTLSVNPSSIRVETDETCGKLGIVEYLLNLTDQNSAKFELLDEITEYFSDFMKDTFQKDKEQEDYTNEFEDEIKSKELLNRAIPICRGNINSAYLIWSYLNCDYVGIIVGKTTEGNQVPIGISSMMLKDRSIFGKKANEEDIKILYIDTICSYFKGFGKAMLTLLQNGYNTIFSGQVSGIALRALPNVYFYYAKLGFLRWDGYSEPKILCRIDPNAKQLFDDSNGNGFLTRKRIKTSRIYKYDEFISKFNEWFYKVYLKQMNANNKKKEKSAVLSKLESADIMRYKVFPGDGKSTGYLMYYSDTKFEKNSRKHTISNAVRKARNSQKSIKVKI